MNFLDMVENLKGQIKVPEFNDYQSKMVWMTGRNEGVKKVRNHVRHHISEPLPWLKEIPSNIIDEFGQQNAQLWLEGYNAPIQYVEIKMNVFLFNGTSGQIMSSRMN